MMHGKCWANGCLTDWNGFCPKHWQRLPTYMRGEINSAERAARRTRTPKLKSLTFIEALADAIDYLDIDDGAQGYNVFRALAGKLREERDASCA